MAKKIEQNLTAAAVVPVQVSRTSAVAAPTSIAAMVTATMAGAKGKIVKDDHQKQPSDHEVQLALLADEDKEQADETASDAGAAESSGDTAAEADADAPAAPSPAAAAEPKSNAGLPTWAYIAGGVALAGGATAALAGGGKEATAKDTAPPVAPSAALAADTGASATDGITRDGTVNVGALETGARWEYSTDNGTSWKAGTGTSFVLTPGTYAANTVQVRQIDVAGNIGPAAKIAGALTVDTTAPGAPVLAAVASDNVVNAAEKTAGIALTGTADAGSSVAVTFGTATKTVVANASGAWTTSFSASEVPVDGAASVRVVATDVAGNAGTETVRAVTVDSTAPAAPVVAVVAGDDQVTATERAAGVAVTGSAEAGASVVVTWGSASRTVTAGANGAFTATFAAADVPAPGATTVRVSAADAAGNSGPTTTRAVTVFPAVAVEGVITAGPLAAGHGLSVSLFAANGTVLVSGVTVNADGSFRAEGLPLRPGDVVIAKVVDASAGSDYLDEATGVATDVNAQLLSVQVATGSSVTMHINPLTTLVAIKAGLASDGTGTVASAAAVTNAALAVAAAFGLTGADVLATTPVPTNGGSYNPADGFSAGEKIGATLAALSGVDGINGGNAQTTINSFAAGLTAAGTTGALDGASQVLLMQGASVAEANAPGVLQQAVSDNLALANTASNFGINTVAGDNVINAAEAATLTLTGTVAAGAKSVTLVLGATTATATIAGTTWQYALTPADLADATDGAKLIKATAVLADDSTVVATRVVNVDVTAPSAPVIGAVATDDLVNAAEKAAGVAVSGTAEVGSAVSVVWGSTTKNVVVGAAGTWAVQFAAAEIPVDGATSISATATDVAGNTGSQATRLVVIDTAAPVAPIINVVAGNDVIGALEATANVVVTGSAEAGASLLIKLGTVSKAVVADAEGTWTAIYATTEIPANGSSTVSAAQADVAGNPGPIASRAITVGRAPDQPILLAVTTDNIINAAEANDSVLVGGLAPLGSIVEIAWGGVERTVIVDENAEWSTNFALADLPADGNQTLQITAVKADGSVIGTVSQVIPIDTLVPNVPVLNVVAENNIVNAAEKAAGVLVSGTGEPGAAVTVLWGTSRKAVVPLADGTWSALFASSEVPQDGSTSPSVSQKDAAGNESAAITRTVIVDTGIPIAPSIALVQDTGASATDYITNNGAIRVSGLEPGVTWEYSSDGGESFLTGDGNEFLLTEDVYQPGQIVVRQTDQAGNVSPTAANSWKLVIDVTAPDTALDEIARDGLVNAAEKAAGVIVTGASEAGSVLTVRWGTTTKTVTVAADGKWSLAFATAEIPGDGETIIFVDAVDIAGNATDAAAEFPAVIDTQAPGFAQLILSNDTGASDTDRITTVGIIDVAELESGSTWEYSTDGGSTFSIGSGTNFELFDGKYAAGTVQVRQSDQAGNVSAVASLAGDLVVDSVSLAPVIEVVATDDIVNAQEKIDGIAVTGTAEAGASVQVTLGTAFRTVTADNTGAWSATFATGDIPADGAASINAVQTDLAGNISSIGSRAITIDTAKPAAPTVARIAGDGVVNGAEKAAGVTVTGTASANASIQVGWAIKTKTVVANAAGAWSATFIGSELPADGPSGVSARQTNAAGNISDPAVQPVLLDTATVAPTIQLVAGNDVINAAEAGAGVVVSGTAEANAAVEVKWGVVTKTVTANGSGNWTTTFSAGQVAVDGVSDVTARATDTVGNVSVTATRTVRVDTVAPRSAEIAAVTSDNIIIASEKAAGVTISGIAEAGASVAVNWAGVVSNATVGVNGAWSVVYAAGQVPADGDTTVTAAVTDSAGNVSASTTRGVLVSAAPITAPVIGLVAQDNIVSAAEKAAGVRVNGVAAAGAVVTVVWAGVTKVVTANSAGSWTTSFASTEIPADGNTTVQATANGLTGRRAVLVLSAGPTAPAIAIVAADDVVNAAEKAAGVTVTGTTTAGTSVDVSWVGTVKTVVANGSGVWTASFTSAEVPSSGSVPISAVATDQAGNISAAGTRAVTIDTALPVAPAITVVAGNNIVNASEKARGVTVSGTGIAGATVSVTFGGITKSPVVDAGGTWSATYAAGEVPADGSATISARQTSTSGNPSAVVTRTVSIDTAALAPTIAIVAGDNAVNAAEKAAGVALTGSAEAGAAVALDWAGKTFSTTAGANGAWSLSVSAADVPSDGARTLSAVQTDVAGNVSAAAMVAVNVDTDAPTSPTIIAMSNDSGALGDYKTNQNSVQFAGRGDAGTNVNLLVNGVLAGTAVVDGTGLWVSSEIDLTSVAIETSVSVTAVQVDAAGNLSTPAAAASVITKEAVVLPAYTGVTLVGSETPNFLIGSSFADQISGKGGTDIILGLAGDDVITITDVAFDRLDGGAGFDTLVFDGELFTLDLTSLVSTTAAAGKLSGIEKIDLSGTGNNTLVIDVAHLLALSDTTDRLIVDGNSGDQVLVAGMVTSGTTETVGGTTYAVYTGGAATLLVNPLITVSPPVI